MSGKHQNQNISISEPHPAEEIPIASHRTWKNWAAGTTVHGVKFVFDRDSVLVRRFNPCFRVFWCIVILGFICYLCHSIVIQCQRYYTYETVTKTSIIMEDKLQFPAVTICNFNFLRNNSVNDSKTRDLLKEMYLKETNLTAVESLGDEFLKSINLNNIFMDGSPELDDTFRQCRWIKDVLPCKDVMLKRRTRKGYCYTFGSKEMKRTYSVQTPGTKAGVMFLLFVNQQNYLIGDDESAGFKIAIHDVDEEPDLDVGIQVSPGYTHYIGLNKEEQIFLPHPVKAFGKRKCTNTREGDFVNPLKFYEDYSLYACLVECRSDYVYDYCGCIGPFDSGNLFPSGNYTRCHPLKVLTCMDDALQNFRTKFDVDACKCPFPCHVTTYHTRITSAYYPNNNWLRITEGNDSNREWLRDNFLQVRIYYESLGILQRQQMLKFTREDLISSIGGFLGLCIGASLISILEFIELCVLSVIRGFRRNARNVPASETVSSSTSGTCIQTEYM